MNRMKIASNSYHKSGKVVAMILMLVTSKVTAQEAKQTDASLLWKNGKYVGFVEAKDGDLFDKLMHHGPAVENLWVAYRIYFDRRMSVDIYSKFNPRLELKKAKWYPNDSLAALKYGKDNYKVGKTVGLGGLRLWDDSSVVNLDTETNRTSKIIQTDSTSEIQMVTYRVPYKGTFVDIEMKLTVFEGKRYAQIEATVLSDEEVEFVTGITLNPDLKVQKNKNAIITWGDYDSDVAKESFDVGAAIMFQPEDFRTNVEATNQHLIISYPVNYIKYYVVSSNEKEQSDQNTFSRFASYVKEISTKLVE